MWGTRCPTTRKQKIPNYVAWTLTPERFEETVSRTDKFLPDPEVDDPVTTDDYKRSGYDRGHLCPAADNKWNEQAMEESFYMTNICPQNHNLNGGDWKELEEACRDWTMEWGKLYVVAGPILHDGQHKRIGESRVVVPDAFFKVVLCPARSRPWASSTRTRPAAAPWKRMPARWTRWSALRGWTSSPRCPTVWRPRSKPSAIGPNGSCPDAERRHALPAARHARWTGGCGLGRRSRRIASKCWNRNKAQNMQKKHTPEMALSNPRGAKGMAQKE